MARPTITTLSLTNTGTIYGGAALDGPASLFLFGSTSLFDAQNDFDGRFGLNYEPAFPVAGVAVFKFNALRITGGPIYVQGGLPDLALISAGAVSTGTPGGLFRLDGLNSLTIGAQTGAISLGNILTFNAASGSSFRFLHLYARASNITLGAGLDFPTANLFIDARNNFTFSSGSEAIFDRGVFNAGGGLTLGGTINANSLQLYATNGLSISGEVNAANLTAFANSLNVSVGLSTSGGTLSIGAGGISAPGVALSGFDNISVTGSVRAANIATTGALDIGGFINRDTSVATQVYEAASFKAGSGLNFVGTDAGAILSAPTAGGTLTLLGGSALFDVNGINGASFNGGSAAGLLNVSAGGDGGTLNVGTALQPMSGTITVNTPITATTGANNLLGAGGAGGTVGLVANDSIAVNSTLRVSASSGSATSSRGGNVTIDSRKTNGTAISISNSGQILSLLSTAAPGPGGKITVRSAGGAVVVNGATLRADRGQIDIHNNGSSGDIDLTKATLNGTVVKAGALGENGTLNIGGGTISADSQIKLYAGGSNGTVNFTNNVTLNGNSVKTITGNTVTIFDGKTVTINGPAPANVYTNNPNYTGFGGNGSTTGTFGGRGAITQPLSGSPGY